VAQKIASQQATGATKEFFSHEGRKGREDFDDETTDYTDGHG
jgi:hypothetical protein